VRAILVGAAAVIAAAAAILAFRTDAPAGGDLPYVSRGALRGIAIRSGAVEDMPIGRDVAAAVIRHSVFLDEGPAPEPEAFPVRATGHIARGPIPASPTGQVVIPLVEDAPAWLVVWRGLRGGTLERFGDWPADQLVDAVFLVDGVTADCCWVTLFVAGDTRLEERSD
jgi:hypothetical protein